MGIRSKYGKYGAILCSYLLILLIPLVCGVILHRYSKRMVNEQSKIMTEHMLIGIKEQMDAKMEHIWNMSTLALKLDSAERVHNTKLLTAAERSFEYFNIMRELEKLIVSRDGIKDIFLYFKDTDKVAGTRGVMTMDVYGKLFLEKGADLDALRQEFASYRYKESLILDNEKDMQDIYFLMSDPKSFQEIPSCTAVVVVERRELENTLDNACWLQESNILVQEKQGRVLYGIGTQTASHYETGLWSEPMLMMSEPSDVMEWDYLMATPKSVLEESASQMQKFYLMMMFICVFVGFGAAYLMASKNYHPVKILTELIAQYAKQNWTDRPGKGEDHYEWLQKQTEYFLAEHVNIQQILKNNHKELKNYYLLRLLENVYTPDIEENLQKNQINFPGRYFTVIQFSIKGYGSGTNEFELMTFVLENVFSEMMQENYTVYTVHVGERVVGIVNYDVKELYGQIRQIVLKAQEMLEDKFSCEVTALIGGCYMGRMNIFKSYEDSCDIEDYILLLDENLVCYEDVRDREKRYRNHAELDQKLYNAVKKGDLEEAQKQLRTVLKQYFHGKVSLNVYRCLIFDISGTVLKAAESAGCHEAIEKTDVLEQLSVRLSMEQLETLMNGLIRDVCQRISLQQKKNGDGGELSRKVQQYIDEHYRDPDLNISQTGQYFHITPAYLSAVYKKQTGSSLLEYINRVRLEQAEYLLEQGVSVNEVAECAGFRDSTYFIRVYKKKRGITPGQKSKIDK